MTERSDFEEINPARVAIKDKNDIEIAESQASSAFEQASATVLSSDGGFLRNRRSR